MNDKHQDEFGEDDLVIEIEEGERPCPVCSTTMHLERSNNVTIDVCPEHGIWLDGGELDAIISATRSRMSRIRGHAVRTARRRGKVQGAFWGWISFLWD